MPKGTPNKPRAKLYRTFKRDGPHPIDIHVGKRLRMLRKIKGESQTWMGDQVGLTFQQVQKYERGSNRIGASRLYELANALDAPVSVFFDDLEGYPPQADPFVDAYQRSDTMELARAFNQITEPHLRKGIFDLCKAFARHYAD